MTEGGADPASVVERFVEAMSVQVYPLRAAGELDKAQWTTAYMKAADERMKALRCY